MELSIKKKKKNRVADSSTHASNYNGDEEGSGKWTTPLGDTIDIDDSDEEDLNLSWIDNAHVEFFARMTHKTEPQLLKEAVIAEHSSYGIISALLLTVAGSQLLYGPQNWHDDLDPKFRRPVEHIFLGGCSVSFVVFFSSITVSSYMYTLGNAIPAHMYARYLMTMRHAGITREPARFMSIGVILLQIAMCAQLYLTWGGFYWLWMLGAFVVSAAMYGFFVALSFTNHYQYLMRHAPKKVMEKLIRPPEQGGGRSEMHSLIRWLAKHPDFDWFRGGMGMQDRFRQKMASLKDMV